MFKALAEYAEKAGKRFCATFGTTETSARMAYLPPEMARLKTGSIGKAIPEGELFLLDVNGNEMEEPEAQGELGYRGPNVTMGYGICREDLLKGDEWDGEYHTGDIAKRDLEGYYFIIGRKKRFLKLFGLRISLDQSERIIKEKFNCECACTGDDDKMKIYIVDGALKDQIPGFLAEKLNLNASAFEVKMCIRDRALPEQTAGDLAYAAAENLFEKTETDRSKIGALVFVTQSPDYRRPATACVLQKRLGLSLGCAAMDIGLGCSGFVYGLQTAASLMASSDMELSLIHI